VRRAFVGARAARDTVAGRCRPARAASRAVLGEDVTEFRWARKASASGDVLGVAHLDIEVIPL